QNRETVLKNLSRLVAENGRMLIMDPHPLWLTPWFGSEERPFGIIESYKSSFFRVIPSLDELTSLLERCGLAIRRIHEPAPVPEMAERDRRAYNFYREFPAWWVFELTPVR